MQKYDWLGIILTAIAALIIWFVCEKTGMMRANTNDPTLDYYIKLKNKYQKASVLLFGVYCWLTLSSLYASVIILYISVYAQENTLHKVFLYSVISLFCTIINFVLNLRDIAATFRKCFILLEAAVLKTRDGHDQDPDWNKDQERYKELYQADHQAEEMLSNVIR